MNPRLSVLLLCLLLGVPAWGASGLDAARGRAQAARTEVRSLRGQQQSLRDELNGLAARIEALKAERQGRLTTGTELDAALRRSQELSGSLTGLAQSVVAAEGESERAHLALHTALSDELGRLRAAWDATSDRGQRAKLLEAMRTVRAERDAVRAALPASRVPALDGAASVRDDPEDLLEQADTLRDTEDKVRERLKALRGRITEVREERDLDRRMNDFLGEESMFDEQDRRLRVRLSGDRVQVDRAVNRGGGASYMEDSPGAPTGNPAPPPGVSTPGDNVGGNPNNPGSFPNEPVPSSVTSARASDRRPQVDSVRAQDLAAGGPVDLAAMEAEAARLESLARELDGRASTLEHRAQELDKH
ncbi:TetR family transcriptional regulator [Pyxidicoccus parkwayensis]|uniref:TetR family transcriptional regulator n=1 Tax=Pyxidicoccus parkwayensis TaxID=2813578 RepID=A0ABX7NRG6_9BACT|nr:TetR family transcriptional regulator [Pyxidicoccus parkwaysis]QSQ19996.1 TetR family transcriptional regulator [Pyxidicoccus parkwaysis]